MKKQSSADKLRTEIDLLQGDGKLILILEPELLLQNIIKEILEDFNYKTLIAKDTIEALRVYNQNEEEINAVFVDIVMPKMDELKIISTIRTVNPDVKILATSCFSHNEKKALTFGVNKFLSKPYTATNLLAALSEV